MILSKDATTVTLPEPSIGDAESIDTNKIVRAVRGGVLKVGKPADWASKETYTYSFVGVIESVRDAFVSFVEDNAGLEITVTDHNGVVRTGYIITDVAEIITTRDGCNYELNFTFLSNTISFEYETDECGSGSGTVAVEEITVDNPNYFYIATEETEAITTEDGEIITLESE